MPLAFITPLIRRADALAAMVHKGTFRKFSHTQGKQIPAIEHPRRVAAAVSHLPDATEIHVAAALLHDVLKAGPDYVTKLQQFPKAVVKHVDELTSDSKKLLTNDLHTKRLPLKRAQVKLIDRKFLAIADKWTRKIKLIDRYDHINDLDPRMTPHDFYELYCQESEMLAEALCGTDPILEKALTELIKTKIITLWAYKRFINK